MTSTLLKKCPSCSRMGLRRLIGAGAGIIFKGSGFYETDYRRSSKKTETSQVNGSDSSTKSPAAKSKEDTTKTKTESTSNTKE